MTPLRAALVPLSPARRARDQAPQRVVVTRLHQPDPVTDHVEAITFSRHRPRRAVDEHNTALLVDQQHAGRTLLENFGCGAKNDRRLSDCDVDLHGALQMSDQRLKALDIAFFENTGDRRPHQGDAADKLAIDSERHEHPVVHVARAEELVEILAALEIGARQ
jgi:hypothetical protein